MKYYSEKTRNFYDEEKELLKAEKEFDQKQEEKKKAVEEAAKKQEILKAERGVRAKEVEEAFAKANEAKDIATKLLNDFMKDYGSYHSTIKTTKPVSWNSWFFDMFDNLLR